MELGLTKNQIISELSKSPHGKLQEYVDIGQRATREHPEFMAHLISWDRVKGQVRDAKVALPIVSLLVKELPNELAENSLAHLACLGPREFLKAVRFAKELHVRKQAISRVAALYLRQREQNTFKWDRLALQHRATLRELYALTHTRPSDRADAVLFRRDHDGNKAPYPAGSLFEIVSRLKDLDPVEAAGTVIKYGIPFLVAQGALGKKAKEPDVVLALIKSMTPTELVTNAKMLEKLGMKKNSALRGAFDEAVGRAAKSKHNVLKTSVAAEAVEDEELKENLRGLQDKQLEKLSVEGNWLVLGDKSSSMTASIDVARNVAATLSKMVKGKVWLVFFDTTPQTIPIPEGTPLDAIQKATKYIQAQGNTSIGCGLQRMLDEKIEVDGIAIVSDGGENTAPYFSEVYKRYSAQFDKQVPVYFYQTTGDRPALIHNMEYAKLDMQVFDLTKGKIDYYSLPNLVKTMRTNRYSLIDEIMASRLLTLSDVFKVGYGTKATVLD